MPKRFILLLVLWLTIVGLDRSPSVRAANSYPSYQFTAVQTDLLYASAAGNNECPDVDEDTARYQFELAIDADLLMFLKDTLAAGDMPVVAFRTIFSGVLQGQGEVSGDSRFALAIEHAGGGHTVIYAGQHVPKTGMVMPGDNVQHLINNENVTEWRLDFATGNRLSVGDTLLLGGSAQGTADSVGCESGDQATIGWELKGVNGDPDRPIIIGSVSPAE